MTLALHNHQHKIHEGRNVKRFREMLGIKQETLALELGEDWSQKRISMLENKATIEQDILAQVSQALKVPEEVLKTFEEGSGFNLFNTFNDNSTFNNNCESPHSNEKLLEIISKNQKLYSEIIELHEENKKLYERLLQSEREKMELLLEKK